MNRRTSMHSIVTAVAIPLLLHASPLPQSAEDSTICERTFALADSQGWQTKPIGDVVIEVGKAFVGTEYVANALEQPGAECLVVNLRGFDCVTFYENCLAFARCIKKSTTTFDAYRQELTLLRYRGGILNGYISRLHYTSDYFFDNERKGILRDVTREIGGEPFVKTVNFMSTHPDSYSKVKEHPEFVPLIAALEADITKRQKWYIAKENLAPIAATIKNGDIIGITTSIDGLDITHTGIAIWKDKTLHFLHAPITGAKVQVTELPLTDYLARIKKDTGIMVARPQEPITN